MSIEVQVRCKTFTGEAARNNKFLVEDDGAVLAWDSVAGHYTSCHSVCASALRRIRNIATLRHSAPLCGSPSEVK